jgi:ribonuclease P protein component
MPAFPMLRRKADFEAIARQGSARSGRLLVMRSLRTDGGAPRIGIATSKALGGAVERNRVRRRLRALVREHYGSLPSGLDLLVIARPEAARATWTELRDACASLLRRSDIGA